MRKEEYVESEKIELERLGERLDLLENKWFKKEGMKEEVEFLKIYIKEKYNMIKKISEKKEMAK